MRTQNLVHTTTRHRLVPDSPIDRRSPARPQSEYLQQILKDLRENRISRRGTTGGFPTSRTAGAGWAA